MTSLAPASSGIDHDAVPAPAPVDGAGSSRPASTPRLWLHLGLLALALAAVVALAKPDVSTWDEGSYGAQADILREEGGWFGAYRFDDIDPSGRWYPIIYSDHSGDGYAPYVKHPFVPALQRVLGGPLGRAGYAIPSVVGVLGAATAAWAIARRVRPGTQVVAFWLIGSGPLLFHASIIWAHSMAAAFGGLAVLGAVMVRQRRSSWLGHLTLAAGGAGVILVRSEGLLLALSVLAALGLDALLRPPAPEAADPDGSPPGEGVATLAARFVTGVVSVLPAFVVVVAVWLLEQRWVTSIVGTAGTALEVKSTEAHYSYLGGRVNGLWASTLSGSDLAAWAPVLPVVLLVPLAVVAWRRRIARPDVVAVAIGGYALVMALLQVMKPSMLVTGFVPAWPLVPIGLVACGAGLWRRYRLLSLTVALTALAIWATQYPDGGVFQWGGRFLMVLAVPAAVLAADGIRRLLDEAAEAGGVAVRKTAVFGAVVALAVVGAVAPVVALRTTREQFVDTLGTVEAASGPVAVTTSTEMPRLMWRSDIDFLRVDKADVDEALTRLREAGYDEVSLIATAEVAEQAAPSFGQIEDRTEVPSTDLSVWTLTA